MFDFEKLDVYQKAKEFHQLNDKILEEPKLSTAVRRQLHRASLSVVLNLAEGSGRFTKRDRRNFYIVSRSSVFECSALLDILKNAYLIPDDIFTKQYEKAEEISRILLALIKGLSN